MQDHKLALFFRDALIIAFGVLIAAYVLGENRIHYDNFLSLFGVAIVISLLNAFLRPVMITFALPILISTFGLGSGLRALLNPRSLVGAILAFAGAAALLLWFINACIFKLADVVAGSSFVVNGFGSAMLGSIFTSCATLFICVIFGIKRQSVISQIFHNINFNATTNPPNIGNSEQARRPQQRRRDNNDDDVIDI